MFSSTKDAYEFFDLLRRRISNQLVIKEINSDEIILRSDIKNASEASLFVGAYGALSHSRFREALNSYGKKSSTPGMKWICTYKRMNVDTLRMSSKCPAMVNIVLKRATKSTKIEDDHLRGLTSMRAVIKISTNHNHIIEDPWTDKYLRISSPVKECFFEYFKRGIFGTKAKQFHEQNLIKANFQELNDESMNPSLRAIFALFRQWSKLKENGLLTKVISVSEVSQTVKARNVPMEDVTQFTDNSHIVIKEEVDPFENNYCPAEIQSQVLQSFSDSEDVKPIVNIKQEIDEDTGLPVIESYGSVATPPNSAPVRNSTPVTKPTPAMEVNSVNSSVVAAVNRVPNAFKLIKYLSVGSKYICSDHSSSQYNTYLPRTLLPSRVAAHRM